MVMSKKYQQGLNFQAEGIQENRRQAGWATRLGLALSALKNCRPQQPEDKLRVILHP